MTNRRLPEIRLHVRYDGDKTFATATIPMLSKEGKPTRLIGAGYSQRHPNDTPNEHIGISVAVARALYDLGEQLEDDAM